MNRQSLIGVLLGVGVALLLAFIQLAARAERLQRMGSGGDFSFVSKLFDFWFEPAVVLAIISVQVAGEFFYTATSPKRHFAFQSIEPQST